MNDKFVFVSIFSTHNIQFEYTCKHTIQGYEDYVMFEKIMKYVLYLLIVRTYLTCIFIKVHTIIKKVNFM